jgi:hypothetical protein
MSDILNFNQFINESFKFNNIKFKLISLLNLRTYR